jgi:hypothetical protein
MPRDRDHLHIANNNEQFSQFLMTNRAHLDWAVTGMFYAAMHYIEAYLATQNIHSGSHRMRDSSIYHNPVLSIIYDDYNDLKNDSIQARYYGHNFTLVDITSRIQSSLNTVKSHIEGFLDEGTLLE